jgi:hypothetical protein
LCRVAWGSFTRHLTSDAENFRMRNVSKIAAHAIEALAVATVVQDLLSVVIYLAIATALLL